MLKSAPKNPKKSSKAVPKTTPKNTSLKKTAKRGYSHSYKLPPHVGEKALTYPPGSPERAQLAEACSVVRNETVEVPVIINGKKHYTKNVVKQLMPSDHKHVVANVHLATAPMLEEAIENGMKARRDWAAMPLHSRAMVFRRAADLIATKHRARMNAVTMIGGAKTVWQAEIDSAQEQIDFLRLNGNFAEELSEQQPPLNSPGVWNRVRYRPLEGFISAVCPFNFPSIGTNLNAAPALMGNVTLWKPSMNAALQNFTSFEILQEAGLPDGVINFVPSDHDTYNQVTLSSQHFAGLHFTGSTEVFGKLWAQIGNNLSTYRSYPRIVGETGGKNFHLIHPSADVRHAVLSTLRSAFEYQGQKCSAVSRLYVPRSLWNGGFRDMLLEEIKTIKQGQPDDFSTFMSSVINEQSANKQRHFIEQARTSTESQIIAGGEVDTSRGWFVQPTVILTTNPNAPTMETELFGPVLTAYVYDDHAPNYWHNVTKLVDSTSPYGLTGSVFASDRHALNQAEVDLVNSCGNLYFNDKSTGAVVGEQPFGGSRMSGTNDKAGSGLNLMRWVTPQTIKETTTVLTDYRYPHMM
jgi:1-pyrroline-5-carboxylate dehydrogenase